MPKPPVDHSQLSTVKVNYPFKDEWLCQLHKENLLSGDPKAFVEDIKASYELFFLSNEAFVTSKEHKNQFALLEKDPEKYLPLMRHQETTWLKRAGWAGDICDVVSFIPKVMQYISTGQKQIGMKGLGRELWDIWIKYDGKRKPYEGLDVETKEELVGFPAFYVMLMEQMGRKHFENNNAIKASIREIKPSF